MNALDQLFSVEPYSLSDSEKSKLLFSGITSLTRYHLEQNASYRNILDSIDYNELESRTLADFPFIPVRIFKEIDLITNPQRLKLRSLNSSGTTGQATSRIYIDSETSNLQKRCRPVVLPVLCYPKRSPSRVNRFSF